MRYHFDPHPQKISEFSEKKYSRKEQLESFHPNRHSPYNSEQTCHFRNASELFRILKSPAASAGKLSTKVSTTLFTISVWRKLAYPAASLLFPSLSYPIPSIIWLVSVKLFNYFLENSGEESELSVHSGDTKWCISTIWHAWQLGQRKEFGPFTVTLYKDSLIYSV